MNGVLKLILGQIILQMNLEAKLAGEFRQTGFTTFSEPARKFCSEALSELIRRMGTPERRQKIVEGFEQTLLGPVRHSELEGVLELGRELERDHPVELETRKSHPCPHGCAKPSLGSSTPELSVSNVTKRHAGVAATVATRGLQLPRFVEC